MRVVANAYISILASNLRERKHKTMADDTIKTPVHYERGLLYSDYSSLAMVLW